MRDDLGKNWYGFEPERVAVVPGLSDGCILEYRIVRKWPVTEPMSQRIFLQNPEPTKQLTFTLRAPKELDPHLRVEGASLERASERGQIVYRYARADVPPIHWEPFAPPVYERIPKVWIALPYSLNHLPDERDERDLARRFRERKKELNRYRRVGSLDIMRQARRLTKGASSREEKLAILYRYVAEEIDDKAVRNQFHDKSTAVLANRYANPFQKTSLLRSFAESLGIETQTAFYLPSEYGRSTNTLRELDAFLPCLIFASPQRTHYLAPYWQSGDMDVLPLSMRARTCCWKPRTRSFTNPGSRTGQGRGKGSRKR
ncbi:DUF3857 domain-containing protein [Sulfidibacter corallicola]|uniref:DUF3857 domain-containing protein n=1 Tax=Sulfidibacter corallicola TaxID=2818388 RepID=A0A8A4TJ71_SULCO|nr:DUF3857 domain-containing protein [Sulfidibacter corallicola]QTD49537.1 DUF3857 domain-containing protein [Sulfidibacter corallicola]